MRPDPKVLVFDTSGPYCAAALVAEAHTTPDPKDCGPIQTWVEDMARGQAERLIPFLEACLASADLGWADLDGVGVCVGPGNFTGIRIAVSAARGLALGRGIPAVGVSSLEATGHASCIPFPYYALVPAPRDMAYAQRFDLLPAKPKMLTAQEVEALPDKTVHQDNIALEQRLVSMATIAFRRCKKKGPPPTPLYVKPPDAAPSRDVAPRILTA